MWRSLLLTGVCVLLVVANTEAKERNTQNFWNLWNSGGKGEPVPNEDFTYDDVEGSGKFPDDEDLGAPSGFEELDSIKIDKDKVDNSNLGDDEDYLITSGSGDDVEISEEVIIPKKQDNVDTKKPTATPLTACQNLRKNVQEVPNYRKMIDYMPECDMDGNFKRRQCKHNDQMKEHKCWCVDNNGAKVNGTEGDFPELPGCDFGDNMTTCVFQLVQHSQGLIGRYKPNCEEDGSYKPVQCAEAECWCVDINGNEMLGTVKTAPQMPDCTFVTTTVKTVVKPKTEESTKPGYEIPDEETDDIDIVIPPGTDFEPEVEVEVPGNTANHEEMLEPMEHKQGIMQQPGLFAAIIGGAVVGLLCMVLLVMFIVYRMRKKDEGSYPLDEQKYQNYSYAKAPDKEFYA